jgi:hypothetical protein
MDLLFQSWINPYCDFSVDLSLYRFKLLSSLFLVYCFTCFSYYFVCFVICNVSPFVYYCPLPFVYKCKDHCLRVETQLLYLTFRNRASYI